MKILHVLDHSIPLHSGYTFRTLAILREQHRLGWQTCQLTSPKQGVTNALEEHVEELLFYRTPPVKPLLAALPVLGQVAVINALARRLEQVIDRERPDIVHAHSPALNGLAALRAARAVGVPCVYEIRAFWEDAAVDHGTSSEGGLRYRATRALESHVVKRANAVTTICNGLKQDLLGRAVSADKITVIPNAVNVAEFSVLDKKDDTLMAELGLEGKTVLGFIGSFYAYEGLDLLVRAMPQLLRARPDFKLLLVGGGPQEEALRQLTGDLALQDSILFAGRVPHGDVARYYSVMDAMIYPRKRMRLTELVTPLKPLEAMAQGRLVIASDVGGHRELINDGVNGFLFQAGDTGALCQRVIDVLSDRDACHRALGDGRHFVETERCWPRSVERYEAVYSGVLGR